MQDKIEKTSFNSKVKSNNFYLDENRNVWLDKKSIVKSHNGFHCFHLEWEKMNEAKSYAIVVLDYEASRVIGQNFVHWGAANIKENIIEHGHNINNHHKIIQATNSTCPSNENNSNGVLIECIPSGFKAQTFEASIGYFPPMPPDKPHLYQVRIYGLDIDHVDLPNGFFLGQLFNKMVGHVVGVHILNFWSNGVN